MSRALLIATTNVDKLREIRAILAGVPFDLIGLADCAPLPAPDETGRTFEDNARLKALYYAAGTGQLTVAEDSGLEIDALDRAPGVESALYGGLSATYPEKFALIYSALHARGQVGSAARFVCALALARGASVLWGMRATVEGCIAPEPRGQGGFGYDPIFFYPPFGCTLAEAGESKSEVSHRGKAFRALETYLTAGL